MKTNKLSIFLIVLLLFTLFASIFSLTGCGGFGKQTPKLDLSAMENLTIDTNNVSAFSIKNNKSVPTNFSDDTATTSADDNFEITDTDFSLYTTTETYKNGNVEFDSNGIKKVTFIKNVSKNKTTYDFKGNVIDSSTNITQEEIPAKLNKMYASNKYVYMQYISPHYTNVQEGYYGYNFGCPIAYYEYGSGYETVVIRSANMTYDENGISEFDKHYYYSDDFVQSFVMDLSTGYIYKIKNFIIIGVNEGDDDVVVAKPCESDHVDMHKYGDTQEAEFVNYYKLHTDGENLCFRDLMPNKNIEIYGALTDKDGYTYVVNSDVNKIDQINKTTYIKHTIPDLSIKIDSSVLCKGSNNIVYKIKLDGYGNYQIVSKYVSGREIDLTEESKQNETFKVMYKISKPYYDYYTNKNFIAFYKGHLLTNGLNSFNWNDIDQSHNTNNENYVNHTVYEFLENSIYIDSKLIKTNYDYNSKNVFWLDRENIILIKDDIIYAVNIDIDACLDKKVLLKEENFRKISNEKCNILNKDYYRIVGNDRILVKNIYSRNEFSGTKYYKLINKNGLVVLELIENKKFASNIFIFQPINK